MLTLWVKIKGWLAVIGAFFIAIFSFYFLGISKGKKDMEAKIEENNRQQKQVEAAGNLYNKAEEATHTVPPIPTPDVEKRDDLDTTS